jgi:HEAT repeat protein
MTSAYLLGMGLNTSLGEPIIAPAGTNPREYRDQSPVVADQRTMLAALRDLMATASAGLRDSDAGVRVQAQRFFDEIARARQTWLAQAGNSGEDPLREGLKACLTTLIEALRDPDARVRRASVDVLEGMGQDAAPAAPALVEALGDNDHFVRWAAVRCLSVMGNDVSRAALPRLRSLSNDPDTDVRDAAEAAVKRLETRR